MGEFEKGVGLPNEVTLDAEGRVIAAPEKDSPAAPRADADEKAATQKRRAQTADMQGGELTFEHTTPVVIERDIDKDTKE